MEIETEVVVEEEVNAIIICDSSIEDSDTDKDSTN